jgi:hypothetical protein
MMKKNYSFAIYCHLQGFRMTKTTVLNRISGFIGAILQLHAGSNVFNAATFQLPCECFSTTDFSVATERLTHW